MDEGCMDVWMTAALGGRCCSVGSVISNIHHGRRNRSDCINNAKRAVASNRAVLDMPQPEAEGEAEQLTKKRANHGASTIVRFEASNSDWKREHLEGFNALNDPYFRLPPHQLACEVALRLTPRSDQHQHPKGCVTGNGRSLVADTRK